MRDKGLSIFLMVLFGVGGIAILILTWAQPMPLLERILATSVGSLGLLGALTRARLLVQVRSETNTGKYRVEVEVKKKPALTSAEGK